MFLSYTEQLNHRNVISTVFNGWFYLFCNAFWFCFLSAAFNNHKVIGFSESWDVPNVVMVSLRSTWKAVEFSTSGQPWCCLFDSESVFVPSSEAPRLLRCPNHGCHSPQGHLSQPRHPHRKRGQWPQCGLSQHGESVYSFTTIYHNVLPPGDLSPYEWV